MPSEALRKMIAAECNLEVPETTTRDGEALQLKDMILSEFVVVAARQAWTADGTPVTQVVVISEDAPPHRILGLLRNATVRYEADVLELD